MSTVSDLPAVRSAQPRGSEPAAAPAAADLQLAGVTLGYGARAVVQALDLSLPRGAIGCLLGPSGCGKTTVLRAVAGFEPVRAGRILLGGEAISQPGRQLPPERRRIGMVFQDHALFPHLTVAQNVGFGLPRGAASAERVQALLDTVGLGHAARRHPHELSGGQQQRVALARALAPQPRLLLLDEPFSNLDAELRERLAAEVRQVLHASGTTALLVTHDQHEAFAMADQIGVMADGRIQQWDTPYALYHRPANRRVAGFIGQGAFVAGRVVDRHRLQLELGEVVSATALHCAEQDRPLVADDEVDVLLRPDDVVHDDASPLRAVVTHKAFRGAAFLYTLRLPSGAQLLSLVPSHHDHALGEAIGIRLELDHVVAFGLG
jgi:iron(III) transport system ATP-binding protein